MWKKIKSYIINLFTVKAEDEVEELTEGSIEARHERTNFKQQRTQRNQNDMPGVKMTYQYPEKRPFRFPVIPDDRIQTEQIDSKKEMNQQNNVDQNITKMSKRNRQTSEKRSQANEPLRPNSHVKSENKEERIITKRTNKPFRPTEVPSPIYGFRSRNESIFKTDENLDKPAYLRRETKHDYNKQKRNTDDLLAEERKSTITDLEQEESEALVATTSEENEKVELDKASEVPTEKTKAFNKKQNPVQKDTVQSGLEIFNHQAQKNEEEVLDEKNNHKPTKLNESDEAVAALYKNMHQFVKMDKANQAIPYNVIMTGKDYGLTAQKSKKQDVKEQIKRIEVASKVHTELAVQETEAEKDFPLHLLDDLDEDDETDEKWILEQQHLLEETLKHFKVSADVTNATKGPSVTRFEVQPELGVKVSRIRNLSDDLKLNMAAKDIRIEAPIPGKNAVGIEIPNKKARTVRLEEILSSDAFQNSTSPLTIGLGLNIEGNAVITDINKMPHGLIAGATGSGKSVCINTILVSLLYKANHHEVKFLLIDPKMVELAPYNGIPHLVSPVITDVKAATAALKWAVEEMESRYEKFVAHGVRDISRYNKKIASEKDTTEIMPYLVIVIDELADLMMMAPQDVEDAISRIAQKARACGIHLLIATQRPSVDVITGLIKANIPTRIAFSVSQQVDSRTILDTGGAERLLGKGDMLFVENGAGNTVRIQGAFVSDEEIERVTSYARSVAKPNYLFEQEQLLEQIQEDEEIDELLYEVIDYIIEENQASTSSLQRRFRIGYNRAARLMDSLENMGIINKQNGSRPRDVLMTRTQIEEML